ncbi:hypothetical protein D5R93_01250 [Actinomyces lilanjuaniae]|uniref:Uncharacterized protein n=1 Tax=Actinomyces lilanjuaniae TaxID=2321394 RepID=A0ABM6Z198_9ACTO|nr:hypothetical protein [Actinomyces lilanjuaniae]AYD89022.1 hypothetical protein D5R93_01250 [Actinomyces lilanjuaniae]
MGGAGLVAPGASTQGLVRLSPETLASLAAMPARAQGGSLGGLDQARAQASPQTSGDALRVCWLPAGSAQAADLLQGLGRAQPLLRLSAHMTFIVQALEEGTGLVRSAFETRYEDHWPAISDMRETLLGIIARSRETGVIPRLSTVGAIAPDRVVNDEHAFFARRVYKHREHLDTYSAARWEYLRGNIEQIVADYQGYLTMETIDSGRWILSPGRFATMTSRPPDIEKTMTYQSVNMPARYQEKLGHVAEVLTMIDAQRHLCAEVTGRSWPPHAPEQLGGATFDETVAAMRRHVDRLRGRSAEEPLAVAPALQVVGQEVPGQALAALRWLLPAPEPLVALAEVDRGSLTGAAQGLRPGPDGGPAAQASTYLGVTSTRLFLSSVPALVEEGRIELSLPLADLRYVRFRMVDRRAVMDITMKEEDLSIGFAQSAVSSGFTTGLAHRVADILMTAASIPEEEQRSDPLFTRATSREHRE